MYDLIGTLFLLAWIAATIYGIVLLFKKGQRIKGLKVIPSAFLICSIGVSVAATMSQNGKAREAGFENSADMSAATEAGITDPAIWNETKAEIANEQAEEERAAKLEAERLAAEAAAREEAERIEQERLAEAEAAEAAARKEAERVEQERLAEAEAAEEQRKGFHCLSAWDGAHRDFRRDVKNMMRDPDSFEDIETRITPVNSEGYHNILMTYRARNGFGGMNVGQALGLVRNSDCKATVISVE